MGKLVPLYSVVKALIVVCVCVCVCLCAFVPACVCDVYHLPLICMGH